MKTSEISDIVSQLRDELNLVRGVHPKIVDVREEPEGHIHIVTTNRTEKFMVLGPGGRLAVELSKRIGKHVSVYGEDEIIVREHRLNLTLKRIEELKNSGNEHQNEFLNILGQVVYDQVSFPSSFPTSNKEGNPSLKISVALSGGVDSGSSLVLLKAWGFQPTPITIDRGYAYLPPKEKTRLEEFCKSLKTELRFIPISSGFEDVVTQSRKGRIHPCGMCHEIIIGNVLKYSRENEFDVLVTGESLPSGRQSIVIQDGVLVVHLPAVLTLTKYHTTTLSQSAGLIHKSKRFGCPFLKEIHCQGWKAIGPSIDRVLRELNSGFLTTRDALSLVKSIVKDHLIVEESIPETAQ